MAVPKRRTSRSKRDSKRANIKLSAPGLSTCSNCSALIQPHRVCPKCGYYKGVAVVEVASAF